MSPLNLPATLLHDQADACMAKWVAQLPPDLPPAVVLDASGVVEFDSSALAVLLIGEAFRLHHFAGMALILFGVWLATARPAAAGRA